MATLVGTQKDFIDAVKSLIQLDYAAIAAYEDAIKYLENQLYKNKLAEFMGDHKRHVQEFSEYLKMQGDEAPTSAGPKQLLTEGKVMFAQLIGDRAILIAMKTNEDDTNTAYERMNNHPEKTLETADMLRRGLEDERRHRTWIESTIQATK